MKYSLIIVNGSKSSYGIDKYSLEREQISAIILFWKTFVIFVNYCRQDTETVIEARRYCKARVDNKLKQGNIDNGR